MWIYERSPSSRIHNPEFFLCCQNGKIDLPLLPQTLEFLQELFDRKHGTRSSKFRKLIQVYNSMFSFTSMGGKIDYSILKGKCPYAFRISGANYHRIRSLLPLEENAPKSDQLCIYDIINEVKNMITAIQNEESSERLNITVTQRLQEILNKMSWYFVLQEICLMKSNKKTYV